MRWLLVAVILAGPVAARAGEWTTEDTVRQGIVTGLLALDWYTTSRAQDSAVWRCAYHEHNPVLGWYPSPVETGVYFATVIVVHAAVAYVLPDPWRSIWQYVTIGAELMEVGRNFQLMADLRIPL